MISFADHPNSAWRRDALPSAPEIETFVDRYLDAAMAKHHIPGAVFAFVKDGEIVLQKGVGFANLEKAIPADPEKSEFRLGSVSKIVTATAVMQLADRGLLDLNADVNTYLESFQIKNPFHTPLTTAHLLTHTSGFDYQWMGRYAVSAATVEPLHEFLRHRLPDLIEPPGTTIRYSNSNIALAGYLIEACSTRPFSQFIAQNLFEPLDMTHSSFEPPRANNPNLVTGYAFSSNAHHPLPIVYPNPVPASALISTAADMSHFMIAHLQQGIYQSERILSDSAMLEMHSRQVSLHRDMPGWCYGFYEKFVNGHRAILHSGGTEGFSCLLYLVPEQKIGFFLAFNLFCPEVHADFAQKLMQRILPRKGPGQERPLRKLDVSELIDFSGSYEAASIPNSTLVKVTGLLKVPPTIEVSPLADGGLFFDFPDTSFMAYLKEPMIFSTRDNTQSFFFLKKKNGNGVGQLYYHTDKPNLANKIAWADSHSLHFKLWLGFYWTFVMTLFAALGYLLKIKFDYEMSIVAKSKIIALGLAGLLSALNLFFLYGLEIWFDPDKLKLGIYPELAVLLCLPIMGVVLLTGLLAAAFRVWKNPSSSFPIRFYLSAVVLAGLAFFPFLDYWNLLGFQY